MTFAQLEILPFSTTHYTFKLLDLHYEWLQALNRGSRSCDVVQLILSVPVIHCLLLATDIATS